MPTRIAIISDIHANPLALQAVVADARRQKVDTYWMLGDAVGRGYDPIRTLRELRKLPMEPHTWLVGNHDSALVGEHYGASKGLVMDERWEPDEISIIRRHYNVLKMIEETEGNIAWLSELKHYAQPRSNIFLAHATYSPNDRSKGLLDYRKYRNELEEDFSANANEWRQDGLPVIVIYGHTHLPVFWQRSFSEPGNNLAWNICDILPIQPQTLEAGNLYHVNPGSVGFPRDTRYPCPNYVILEEDNREFRLWFRFVAYNSELVRDILRNQEYPDSIHNLRHGRLQICKPK